MKKILTLATILIVIFISIKFYSEKDSYVDNNNAENRQTTKFMETDPNSLSTNKASTEPLFSKYKKELKFSPFSQSGQGSNPEITEYQSIKLDPEIHKKLLELPLDRKVSVNLLMPDGQKKTAFVTTRTIYSDYVTSAIGTDNGSFEIDMPSVNFYIGRLENQPNSLVEFTVAEKFISGTIWSDSGTFRFGPNGDPYSMNITPEHMIYDVSKVNIDSWKDRKLCSINDQITSIYFNEIGNIHPDGEPEDLSQIPPEELPEIAENQVIYDQVELALEGDYELSQKLGGQNAVFAYYATMISTINAIYQRDVQVDLKISYQRVWTTSNDPYSGTSTGAALSEIRNYWNSNMSSVSRDVCHFVSGKNVSGGIAYLSVLCNSSYGYGVTQVYGSTNTSVSSGLWDLVAISHELGHNHGTGHTHCYSPAIDKCYNQEGGGCYSGSVVKTNGTIMSYCHVNSGGMFNINLNFHSRVRSVIRSFVDSRNCLTQVLNGPDLEFKAIGLTNTIQLSWEDPLSQELTTKKVYIRRSTVGYPDESGGTLVYTGLDQSFTDNVSQDTKYYYRIWGDDGSGNYEEITFNDRASTLADDGDKALYWHNSNGRLTTYKLSANGSIKGNNDMFSWNPSPSKWNLKAVADVNNDGYADLIWHNSDGTLKIHFLNALGKANGSASPFSWKPSPSKWKLKAVVDVNNDNFADLVWHNSDGTLKIHFLNAQGKTSGSASPFSWKPNPNKWRLKAVVDVNNDNFADLVWHNSDGTLKIHFLNAQGKTSGSASPFSWKPSPSKWNLKAVADVNNDNFADLVWHNSDGTLRIHFLNAQGKTSGSASPFSWNPSPNSWILKAVSDINNDGSADLVWHNSNGALKIHFLNAQGKSTGSASPFSWNPSPSSWILKAVK